jgi:hypothetical protein
MISFNSANYTANVLIMEATSAYLASVPVAAHFDGTSGITNAPCAVLFFDEQNLADAVVIAVYPNGSEGYTSPPPGRTVFVTGAQQITNDSINSGSTKTYTITGSGGIPAGALGILFKAYFTSASTGAYIELAPHGATMANYATIGNIEVANATINGNGTVALDSSGKLDVKANGANVTSFNLFTYGYII